MTAFRTLDELESIRELWSTLQEETAGASVAADIDVFRVEVAADDALEPYVVQINGASARPILIVARRRRTVFTPSIGYLRIELFRMLRDCIEVVSGGCLGSITEQNAGIVVSTLLDSLAEAAADWVYLDGIPEGSPLYTRAQKDPSWFSRDHEPARAVHFTMSVERSVEAFYASQSSKTRWRLRRIGKKLHQAFDNEVRVVIYRDPSEVVRFCTDAEEAAKTTYQRGLGAGFQDGPPARRRLEFLADKGWMHCSVLYLKDKPVAYVAGSLYHGTFLLETLGYIPEMHKHNAGTYLFLQVVEDLCSDEHIHTLDFGCGSDEYKQRFGDRSFNEASIRIFAPTIQGVWINFLTSGSAYATHAGRVMLQKSGRYETLKKKWRRALSSEQETAADDSSARRTDKGDGPGRH